MDDRSRSLVKQRRQILELAPEARIDAIFAAPRPAELVRLLPAQELYLTIVAAGVDRALPLLPLASSAQLDFIFDIDAWNEDTFDVTRAGNWLAAFHEADPELVARWLAEADEELVVLALHRLLAVYKADESTDQAFWPPDRPVPTLDGLYFLEPRDSTPDAAAAPLFEGLTRLRERNRNAYEALLEQVMWLVPTELEESNFERRASRLAERGFPPIDEALEAWAAGELGTPAGRAAVIERLRRADDAPRLATRDASLPVPFVDAGVPLLGEAVRGLTDDERESFLGALVRLGNRFAVASREPLGDPETHRNGLLTSMSFVQLGLEVLAGDDAVRLGPRAIRTLDVFTLSRAGVGAVLERVRRAHALASGWLRRVHLAEERLDVALLDLLHGLLQQRPQLVTAGAERPFRDVEDLLLVDRALSAIEALGTFLERRLGAGAIDLPELVPLPVGRESAADVEWSAVALTSIARSALGGPARPLPLKPSEGAAALDVLLDDALPRRVTPLFESKCGSLGLGGARDYLAANLEDDAGELTRGSVPRAQLVRALLFRG